VTDLAGLHAIDWASLSHPPSSQADVPALLGALASGPPADQASALRELRKAIHPSYETFDVSIAAVPFLVQMALDPARVDRGALIETLARLAVGQPRLAEGVDIRDDVDRSRLEMLHHGLGPYEAVRDALPVLGPLGADPDPSVRIAIGFLLAQFADRATTWAPRVRAWLAEEKEASVRVAWFLVLRLFARFAADGSDLPELEARVAQGSPDDPESIGAALAPLVEGLLASKKTNDRKAGARCVERLRGLGVEIAFKAAKKPASKTKKKA
jgi:hypothetical protein